MKLQLFHVIHERKTLHVSIFDASSIKCGTRLAHAEKFHSSLSKFLTPILNYQKLPIQNNTIKPQFEILNPKKLQQMINTPTSNATSLLDVLKRIQNCFDNFTTSKNICVWAKNK